MIITSDFVFLGMPKTASCWVAKILSKNLTMVYPTKSLKQHGGFKDIPDRFNHLPKFGGIREVDSWCKSAYDHFIPWVKRESIPKGYERFYHEVEKHGIHLEALYNSELHRMFGHKTAILRFEYIRDDLYNYLDDHITHISGELEDDIFYMPPINEDNYFG